MWNKLIKVIETNLSLDSYGEIADHQSRMIEVEGWSELIEEIQNKDVIIRKSFLGNLEGVSIPKNSSVYQIDFSENHGTCIVVNYLGDKTKKLFFRVG